MILLDFPKGYRALFVSILATVPAAAVPLVEAPLFLREAAHYQLMATGREHRMARRKASISPFTLFLGSL